MSQSQNSNREIDDQGDDVRAPLTGAAQDKAPLKKSAPKSRKAKSAFKTISEVADALDVQQHVLRFWETKFSQIRPLKRGGGRRYYRPEDLALLEKIHHLLYTEGYTIKGVQKLLKEKGKAALLNDAPVIPDNNNEKVAAPVQNVVKSVAAQAGMNTSQKEALKTMIQDLKSLRRLIEPE